MQNATPEILSRRARNGLLTIELLGLLAIAVLALLRGTSIFPVALVGTAFALSAATSALMFWAGCPVVRPKKLE